MTDDLTFQYDPTPEQPREPGVTKGYLYIWDGKPGPAQFAEIASIVWPDGEQEFETGDLEFKPCTVIDDTQDSE